MTPQERDIRLAYGCNRIASIIPVVNSTAVFINEHDIPATA
jgi:hypothetical protein